MDINWRDRRGRKADGIHLNWRFELHTEYMMFAERVLLLSKIHGWNFWGSGVDNYAITLSQNKRDGLYITIRINPCDDYKYYVSYTSEINPNNILKEQYKECIGETLDEAVSFLKHYLERNQYEPEYQHPTHCFMGGAYDRYPLAKKWAYEELEEQRSARGV